MNTRLKPLLKGTDSGGSCVSRDPAGPLPDILITDHAMPHMTGADLARQVTERYPELQVILATGYAELPGGEGAGLARLSKPFSQDQLNDALAAVAQSQ
jgi:YesN/AraC family two-component response regulator